MSRQQEVPRRAPAVRVLSTAMASLEQLVGGLGTGFLALLVLVVALLTTAASLLGVGLLLVPAVARILRSLADRERHRLGRFGVELLPPGPAPRRPREVLADRTVRRELAWLACHGTFGLLLGAVGVLLPLLAVRDLTFPLWWRVPPVEISATSLGIGVAHSWADAFAVSFLGVAWIVIILGASPHLAHAQAWFGGRLLAPDAETDLSLRIAELTSTRAAALDAHAVELRRIERSLHDGSQNRLVGVTVLLGAARRALERDPAAAGELLDRAQDAAEQALADLRAVARGILPPVLENRGLAGALTGLASECAVPCEAEIDVDGRCAASVEATAYFVVAEALTNVVKHSGASHAAMTATLRDQRLHLEVTDDGQGGADTAGGSGLDGIRHRVEAYDGVLTLSSPKGGPTILAVELPCGS